jgi:Lon protease-like protein
MPLLPLFPLEVVLFPGAALPLHIFEPRYKDMMEECLAGRAPFGVVRAQENTLAHVGCTAEVVAVIKRHDDGRLDIVTQGRQRFEVIELDQERSFLRGEVEYFDDETGAADPTQIAKAFELHAQMMALLGASAETPQESAPSFQLAAGLPTDLDFKQTLLAMRSESERLTALVEYYEAIIPKLRRVSTVRKRAGGNGHVH